jgi:CubicO group peptidase (beta-lactamase class C family)
MHRMLKALLAVLAVVSLLDSGVRSAANAQEKGPSWPTKEWQTSSPEDQGMDSNELASLIDFGASHGMDSFLVVRHGKIVSEAYYAPFRIGLKHRVNSVTKAIVGTLIGMAFKEGVLASPDQRVLDSFSDRTIANLDERKKALTLQSLLDMTSGIDWIEPLSSARPESFFAMERSQDWQQFILDRPMAESPGAVFNYNSGNAHLLSAIITKVTGRSALDYATEKLFGPLGIGDVHWRHDPQGVSAGGAGLYLQPRDMAKIGTLYLQDGVWEGHQIVPAKWIDRVNHATVDMHQSWGPNLRYASLFWAIPAKSAYAAVGYHGQLIVVMPTLDIVAVVTGSSRFPGASSSPASPRYSLDTLVDLLTGAAKSDKPLPGNPTALSHLASRVQDAAAEKPTSVSEASELAKAISGKVYRFKDNALRLNSFSVDLVGPAPSYGYVNYSGPSAAPTERFGGPIGLDGAYRIGGRRPFGSSAAKGVWLDKTTFVIDVQTLGNDDTAKVSLAYSGKGVDVSFESAGGFRLKLHGEADD